MFIPLANRDEVKDGMVKRYRGHGLDLLLLQTGGTLHIIANVCPHDGSPLAKGAVADGCIRCPKHRIVFDLVSGRALGGEVTEGIPPLTRYLPVWQGEQLGIHLS